MKKVKTNFEFETEINNVRHSQAVTKLRLAVETGRYRMFHTMHGNKHHIIVKCDNASFNDLKADFLNTN